MRSLRGSRQILVYVVQCDSSGVCDFVDARVGIAEGWGVLEDLVGGWRLRLQCLRTWLDGIAAGPWLPNETATPQVTVNQIWAGANGAVRAGRLEIVAVLLQRRCWAR